MSKPTAGSAALKIGQKVLTEGIVVNICEGIYVAVELITGPGSLDRKLVYFSESAIKTGYIIGTIDESKVLRDDEALAVPPSRTEKELRDEVLKLLAWEFGGYAHVRRSEVLDLLGAAAKVRSGEAWHAKDDKVWHEICSYQQQIEKLKAELAGGQGEVSAPQHFDRPDAHEGHNKPCYYCKKPCNDYAGNPSLWSLPFPHRDKPGVVRWHHTGCVMERLVENQAGPAQTERDK